MNNYDYIKQLENKISNHEQTIKNLTTELSIMKIKLEREKNRDKPKVEPDADTGEIPLQIGVAYKHMKDRGI